MSDTAASFPIDETARRRFEAAWLAGEPQEIIDFLPKPDAPTHLGTLAELVQIELEFLWRHAHSDENSIQEDDKKPPSVKDYLERFPQLGDERLKRRIIQQEYLVRFKFGDNPAVQEYQQVFPELSLNTQAIQSEFFPLHVESVSVTTPAATAQTIELLPKVIGSYQRKETRFTDRLGLLCEAYDAHTDDHVVLRIVDPQILSSLEPQQITEWRMLFDATTHKTSRIRHAHVAQTVPLNQQHDIPLYVLNLPPSEPLQQILAAGPLEPRAAVGYLNQVAQAVEAIHDTNQLQGYLTPWNILIDTHRNRALLMDVGFGDVLGMLGRDLLVAIVHPAFRAPEELRGKSMSVSGDIYAIGAVLYYALTGRPPFSTSNGLETRRQALRYRPVPVHRLNPRIDRRLSRICMKCLHKSPRRRFRATRLLVEALSEWASQPERGGSPGLDLWDNCRALLGWCLAGVLLAYLVWQKLGY